MLKDVVIAAVCGFGGGFGTALIFANNIKTHVTNEVAKLYAWAGNTFVRK